MVQHGRVWRRAGWVLVARFPMLALDGDGRCVPGVSSSARSTQPRRAHLPPCTPLPDTTSANNRGEAWLLLATTMGWGRRLLQHLEIYIEIRFKHVQICSYKLCPMWAWCDIYLFSTSISFLGSGNSFLVSQLFTELLISIRSPFRIPSDLCQCVMLVMRYQIVIFHPVSVCL